MTIRRTAALLFAIGTCLAVLPSQPVLAVSLDTLVQVSADPFTAPDFEHRTEVEPAIAVQGRTILAAFQVGRGDAGGSVDIGVAASTDAGTTWSSSMLADATTATGGSYGRASDPSVAYDGRTKRWLVAYLGITLTGRFDEPTRSGVELARSFDGTTFASPITIARAPRGIIYDKPWIACDDHGASPSFGHCYAVWDELGLRSGPYDTVLASTSRDGGAHWSDPVRTADHTHGFGGVPVVRPDGSVVVVYLDTVDPFRPRVATFSSTDGGASWGPSNTIAIPHRALTRFNVVRDPGLPSVAIDERGSIWVAWSDCHFEPKCAVDDIVLSRSIDGLGWSRPVAVAKGTPSTRSSLLTPALAVGLHGRATQLALMYYTVSGGRCGASFRPAGCTVSIGSRSSGDGGDAWGPPTTIGWPMKLGWFPTTRAGYMWGDYVSDAILKTGKAVAVLPLARRPGPTLDVAMYASVRRLVFQGRTR